MNAYYIPVKERSREDVRVWNIILIVLNKHQGF